MFRVNLWGFCLSLVLLKAQLPPPSLRCLEVINNGDIRITWVPVSDPSGQFFSYELYSSVNKNGPYMLVGSVNSLPVNNFIHTGALGNLQSRYYYMITRYGAGGTSQSKSSDTLRSLFLTITNIGNGIAQISSTQLKNPPLPSTASTYTIFREYPVMVFTPIYTSQNYWYNDTVDICSVIYNYQIRISDQYGCISQSQITGDIFQDKTPPRIPEFDSVSVDENNQAMLGWKPATNPDATKYFVYVKDLTTGIVSKIDSVLVPNGPYYLFNSPLPSLQTTAFHVATRDSCKNISPLNTYHQTMFLVHTYDICSGKVVLQWNPYTKFKNGVVSSYEIYMSVNNGPYQMVDQVSVNSWTSQVLQSNATHRFYVRAWNSGRTISSSSNRISFFAYTPPAPSFIYISSCSVQADSSIILSVFRDPSVMAKQADILRSEDGIYFQTIQTLDFSSSSQWIFHDKNFRNKKGPVYYKAVLKDSCNNPRVVSNLVRTIWLKVRDVENQIFMKKLEWTPYYGFDAGVGYYKVFRKSGSITENIGQTPSNSFMDNIEDIAQNGSEIYYYVMAMEAFPNSHSLQDSAFSVIARAYAPDDFFIPNAFAPDGQNKIWRPVPLFIDQTQYTLRIFNRWGNIVFQTSDIHQGWNGDSNPAGIYAYEIQYRTSTGEYKVKTGSVMLLR